MPTNNLSLVSRRFDPETRVVRQRANACAEALHAGPLRPPDLKPLA